MFVFEIIKPDGTKEDINRKMTLEEMQKAVGGYIELCPTKPGSGRRVLVVNEEGLLKDLPVNPEATKLANPGTWIQLPGLRGNVLVARR